MKTAKILIFRAALSAPFVAALGFLTWTLAAVRMWDFGPPLALYAVFTLLMLPLVYIITAIWGVRNVPFRYRLLWMLGLTLSGVLQVEYYGSRQERELVAKYGMKCDVAKSFPRWKPFETSVIYCGPEGWGGND